MTFSNAMKGDAQRNQSKKARSGVPSEKFNFFVGFHDILINIARGTTDLGLHTASVDFAAESRLSTKIN